jgi:hypothetical protein
MSLPERFRQLLKEGKLPKQAWAQLKREYTAQFTIQIRRCRTIVEVSFRQGF